MFSQSTYHTAESLLRTLSRDRLIYIYALCEPDSKAIRYVGKSIRLYRRFLRHCNLRLQSEYKRHSANWLASLLRVGTPPLLIILETIQPDQFDTWEDRERYWIATLRQQGYDLTNTSSGGEGNDSGNGRLGKKNSPEHIAKSRAGRLGKSVRHKDKEAWKASIKRGKQAYYDKMKRLGIPIKHAPCSEERKRKIGDANRGRVHFISPERKLVLVNQAEMIRHLTFVPVIQLDQEGNEIARYDTVKEAAQAIGIGHSGISNCLHGRAKTCAGFQWKRVSDNNNQTT